LKPVEIDHADRKRLVRDVRPPLGVFHRDHQRATVVDTGQVVAPRALLDAFELEARFIETAPQLLHVLADQHEPWNRHQEHAEVKGVRAERVVVVHSRVTHADHECE
jgi:hypothetical protein